MPRSFRATTSWLLCTLMIPWVASASPGPVYTAVSSNLPAPVDRPYPGVLKVSVDATDISRRVFRVHEQLPVTAGPLTLLYPEWIPGTHAPEGPLDKLAGLTVQANGKPLAWVRDPLSMYAFHVNVPAGVANLDLDFQYLSPVNTDVGRTEVSPNLMILEWTSNLIYPAGYYTRQIPVDADLTLPKDWKYGTALRSRTQEGQHTVFNRTTVETLGDSPLYAGVHHNDIDLSTSDGIPVHLQVFADRADQLAPSDQVLAAHRALVAQAIKLYGSHHYDHYDFLLSLSDHLAHQGTEHHQSSEDGLNGNYFKDWGKSLGGRSLLAHEYTHSWNGKFRRPEDLWTPTYNVPMRNSLLWVYEGQTQYWGEILTSRAGLMTLPEALDSLAVTAAYYDHTPGRSWRTLADTTNDEIINPRRPISWENWQRFEDYYEEGELVWLDADTLIRELSHNTRSLDDFARSFFGINNASFVPVTYKFTDIVAALNAVQPYDWSGFLTRRLTEHAAGAPLDGITRGGYRLVYNDTPNLYLTASDDQPHALNLLYSLGVSVDDTGILKSVLWDSPAFKAGLTAGMQLVAVDGASFEQSLLKDSLVLHQKSREPLHLLVKRNNFYRTIDVEYYDGLRYPHLERDTSKPALLDAILAARP